MKRTFLLKDMPENLKGCAGTYVEISYLCIQPAVVMVQRGNNYYLGEVTSKSEYSIDISDLRPIEPTVYAALSTAVKANLVRYELYTTELDSGHPVTINKYLDENAGKLTAVVDFNTTTSEENFVIPNWFGEELMSKSDYKRLGFTLKNKAFMVE